MPNRRRPLLQGVGIASALVLLVAACGGDDDDGTDAPRPTEEQGEVGEPEPGPGFDGATVRLGVITILTGPATLLTGPMSNGARAYFDAVNAELGGIAGKYPAELVAVDNQYDPNVAVEAYNEVKDDVVMVAQVFNVHMVEAILPELQRDGVVAGVGDLGSEFLREQYVLSTGATYEVQAINAMSYWQDNGGDGRSACVAHRDDPHFLPGPEGVEFAADSLGFEVTKTVAFPLGNQDWTTQIDELQGCDMVYLASDPTSAAGILDAAASAQFSPQWIGQSSTVALPVTAGPLADYLQENFWLVSAGPGFGDESVEGVAQLLEDRQQYAPDQAIDAVFAFGYAQAWAVHQVLEKAVEMGDLSRAGIVEAMNSIETLEFGDLYPDFRYGSPDERDPPRESTIFRPDPQAPGGLTVLSEVDFVSDAARSYEFQP